MRTAIAVAQILIAAAEKDDGGFSFRQWHRDDSCAAVWQSAKVAQAGAGQEWGQGQASLIQSPRLQMQFIDPAHKFQIVVRYRLRCVVHRRACQLENLALPGHLQVGVRSIISLRSAGPPW
jgi:hypothetical protein